MEWLIGFGALFGLVIWVFWLMSQQQADREQRDILARAERQRIQAEEQRRRTLAEQARQREEQRLTLNALAKRMQVELLQVAQAPDFRRAAAAAVQAKSVPQTFRRRQFVRFRMRLVQHFATRLNAGGSVEVLLESLTNLVTALGHPDYEADYIRVEAEQKVKQKPRVPTVPVDQQLRNVQQDHDQRVAALQGLEGIEPELREQLLEAEQQRFREALLQANDRPNNANAGDVRI